MPHLDCMPQIVFEDLSPQNHLLDSIDVIFWGPLWVCPALTGLWGSL